MDSNIYACGTTVGNLAGDNAGKPEMFRGICSGDLKELRLRQSGTEKYDCAIDIKTDTKISINRFVFS